LRGEAHGEQDSSSSQEKKPFAIGAYLARQRELRGLSLRDLEDRTRIPRRSLERLEAGVFDGVSDGFARSFVRAVAKALGLDPEDTTMLMLSEPKPGFEQKVRYASIVQKAFVGILALILIGTLWRVASRRYAVYSSGQEDPPMVRVDVVRAFAKAQGMHHSSADPEEGSERSRAVPQASSPSASK